MMRYIALTSANEAAMAAVTHQLAGTIARCGAQVAVLQGVKTAHEAQAIYANHGELWRVGEDQTHPELDALIDRAIDDSSPERMKHEVQQAFERFMGKTQVAA